MLTERSFFLWKTEALRMRFANLPLKGMKSSAFATAHPFSGQSSVKVRSGEAPKKATLRSTASGGQLTAPVRSISPQKAIAAISNSPSKKSQ